MRPKFIVIEGGDGSGKSTLLSKVEAYLREQGVSFLSTREPGGTPVAEDIREVLLRPGRKMNETAELLLYEAARAEHVASKINPALANGQWVICDRFIHSSIAYQGYARGLGVKLVESLNKIATQGLTPDAVIWLKITPEKAKVRLKARGAENRLDAERTSFHEKVYRSFLSLSKKPSARFIVLDASASPDEVFSELLSHPKWRKLFAKSRTKKK